MGGVLYFVVLRYLSSISIVCNTNCMAVILAFTAVCTCILTTNPVVLIECIYRCVLCLWTHPVIVSPHPQSGKCSSPHGKTFLMTMSHSFRSKTAISTQVMVDVNSTLCSHILQLPYMWNRLTEQWRSQIQILANKGNCIWWEVISYSRYLCVII